MLPHVVTACGVAFAAPAVAIVRRAASTAGGSWFMWHLRADSRRISDADLRILLAGDWRSRLTAARLIAISDREQFVGELGALFTQSAVVCSGQGSR